MSWNDPIVGLWWIKEHKVMWVTVFGMYLGHVVMIEDGLVHLRYFLFEWIGLGWWEGIIHINILIIVIVQWRALFTYEHVSNAHGPFMRPKTPAWHGSAPWPRQADNDDCDPHFRRHRRTTWLRLSLPLPHDRPEPLVANLPWFSHKMLIARKLQLYFKFSILYLQTMIVPKVEFGDFWSSYKCA